MREALSGEVTLGLELDFFPFDVPNHSLGLSRGEGSGDLIDERDRVMGGPVPVSEGVANEAHFNRLFEAATLGHSL